MPIIKYYHHQGTIEDLSARYSAFKKIKSTVTRNGTWHEWTDKDTQEVSLHKMVLFIGKTGYGKSTTVNAIAGENFLETSDTVACTQVCQCIDYRVNGQHWLSLGDLPGVGESMAKDEEYIKMYEDFLSFAAVVIHVIRADTRDYSIDEDAINRLFNNASIQKRVIFALGQCDKIEPINRCSSHIPTELQMKNIDKKVADIHRVFSPKNTVIPYSAITGWNMHRLTREIVRVALQEHE